jgi:hypothetical protein
LTEGFVRETVFRLDKETGLAGLDLHKSRSSLHPGEHLPGNGKCALNQSLHGVKAGNGSYFEIENPLQKERCDLTDKPEISNVNRAAISAAVHASFSIFNTPLSDRSIIGLVSQLHSKFAWCSVPLCPLLQENIGCQGWSHNAGSHEESDGDGVGTGESPQ